MDQNYSCILRLFFKKKVTAFTYGKHAFKTSMLPFSLN